VASRRCIVVAAPAAKTGIRRVIFLLWRRYGVMLGPRLIYNIRRVFDDSRRSAGVVEKEAAVDPSRAHNNDPCRYFERDPRPA